MENTNSAGAETKPVEGAPALAPPAAASAPSLAPTPRPAAPSAPAPDAQTRSDNRLMDIQTLHSDYEKELASLGSPPKREEDDPMKALASLGGIIGVVGSFLTKRPMVAALTSMAAAQKAQAAGNQQEYENKLKEWDTHYKFISATQKARAQELQAIQRNDQLTENQKMAQFRMIMMQQNLQMRGQAHSDAVMNRMVTMNIAAGNKLEGLERTASTHILNAAMTLGKDRNLPDDQRMALVERTQVLIDEWKVKHAADPHVAPPSLTDVFHVADGLARQPKAADQLNIAHSLTAIADAKDGKVTLPNGLVVTSKDVKAAMGATDPSTLSLPAQTAFKVLQSSAGKGTTLPVTQTDTAAGPPPDRDAWLAAAKKDNPLWTTEALAAKYDAKYRK